MGRGNFLRVGSDATRTHDGVVAYTHLTTPACVHVAITFLELLRSVLALRGGGYDEREADALSFCLESMLVGPTHAGATSTSNRNAFADQVVQLAVRLSTCVNDLARGDQ